jgi:nitronate monooxygenase
MWKRNELTRRLSLDAPIVQGPFGGGLSAVDLVVAVSESGGLGSFGVHHLEASGIREVAERIRARTRRPFALNLWIPLHDSDDPRMTDGQWQAACESLRPFFSELGVEVPPRPARFSPRYDEQIEALLEVKPPVFSFVFGVPAPAVLERCRSAGIVTVGAATTPAEAKLLADAGVDLVVATGFEAGGHRVSFVADPETCLTGTLALVPQVVDTVKIPVIAAGGMADGRGIAAALKLGASAVQIGTAFLACEESKEAVQCRCAPHHADARLHGTSGAQHPQRIHRCHGRQDRPAAAISRAELADRAVSPRRARRRAHRPGFPVGGAGRAVAATSTRGGTHEVAGRRSRRRAVLTPSRPARELAARTARARASPRRQSPGSGLFLLLGHGLTHLGGAFLAAHLDGLSSHLHLDGRLRLEWIVTRRAGLLGHVVAPSNPTIGWT